MSETSALTLPVLDLSRLDAGEDTAEAAGFRADLLRATSDFGFFLLTGHGVDADLQARLLEVSRRFFALPEQEKRAIENLNSPQFRGWTRIGGERTLGAVDWREQIDVGPELPPREVTPGEPDYWRLVGPNLWPASLPELREVVEEWRERLSAVGLRLLRSWARALGSAPDVFDDAFAHDPSTLIKIVRYPGRAEPEAQQGVGAHKDSGVLTLLWVEPGKAGLQVEKDGGWIAATPEGGALVVNIGELLEVATHGVLKATVHRVESPPQGQDRISVPFFFNPALDATVPVLDLAPELAGRAGGVTQDPDNPIFTTYGENAWKSRTRAHPDVAERHHADVLGRA